MFKGRATRPEFWVFVLVNWAIAAILLQIDMRLGLTEASGTWGLLNTVFALGTLVPTLAVGARRLHDSGITAVWWLLVFVPLVGIVALIVLWARPSQHGANLYGPDPRGEIVVDIPPDGGAPFATQKGRFVRCPWCGRTNPQGRSQCQWCHKAYREVDNAGPPDHA